MRMAIPSIPSSGELRISLSLSRMRRCGLHFWRAMIMFVSVALLFVAGAKSMVALYVLCAGGTGEGEGSRGYVIEMLFSEMISQSSVDSCSWSISAKSIRRDTLLSRSKRVGITDSPTSDRRRKAKQPLSS